MPPSAARSSRNANNLKSIVLCTTISSSLVAMQGFPEFLAGQGWNVSVVSSPGRRLSQLAASSALNVVELEMARNPSPVRDLAALFKWIRLMRQIAPDVVLAGTPKAGLLSLTAAWLTRVPNRLYILRGLRLETARGLLWTVLWVSEKFTMHISHKVIAVSPSLAKVTLKLGLTSPEKITVLGNGSSNGVDTSKFALLTQKHSSISVPERRFGGETNNPIPTIGFVGRINADKGFGVLINALRILKSRGMRFNLLIVGQADGSGAKALIKALSFLQGKVFITGWVEDPAEYYLSIDILCLPSLREGFPNVVLEASAAGIPSVVSDATGVIDSVIDQVTGIITLAGDPASLANGIERLMIDPEMRKQMGEAARNRVTEEFDRMRIWKLTEDFLNSSSTLAVKKNKEGNA